MEFLFSRIVLLAGCTVVLLGDWPAVILAGFFPIYMYLFISLYIKKVPINSSLKNILGFAVTVIISLLWSAIIFMSAMVLGQWG